MSGSPSTKVSPFTEIRIPGSRIVHVDDIVIAWAFRLQKFIAA